MSQTRISKTSRTKLQHPIMEIEKKEGTNLHTVFIFRVIN